jgi:hypothetical protein
MVIIKVKTKPQVFFDCNAQWILMNREVDKNTDNSENNMENL